MKDHDTQSDSMKRTKTFLVCIFLLASVASVVAQNPRPIIQKAMHDELQRTSNDYRWKN